PSGAAKAVTADVADESACLGVVAAALDAFGAADILVNVANYPVPPGRAEEIDLAHWHRSFAAGPLAPPQAGGVSNPKISGFKYHQSRQ
ncbi:MAG TPA: hypothetical protein VKG80_07630, partial [Trebonia sp.]|nr:hypothetical protein [Trebonia sp.]